MIIACEGEKTEPQYFDAIRMALRLPEVKIVILSPEATDPRSIVQAAVDYRRQEIKARTLERDIAWAVFDGDEHIQNDPANWNDALQLAKARNIRLAVSNPSFELWYLLHFQDQFGHLTRSEAIHRLKGYVPNYAKSDCLYPAPLAERTLQALERARKLAQIHERAGNDRHANPCADGVAELVATLLTFAERGR